MTDLARELLGDLRSEAEVLREDLAHFKARNSPPPNPHYLQKSEPCESQQTIEDVIEGSSDPLQKSATRRRDLLAAWLRGEIAKGVDVAGLIAHARSSGDARTANLMQSVAESENLL